MPAYLLIAADFVKTGGMDRANYALADYLARCGAEVHLVAHSVGDALRSQPNVHWHPVARPFGHDALGWGRLARAGRRWNRRLARRPGGVRVLVNGGNCALPGAVNWVHYVHAAYRSPLAAGPLRRAWQSLKHRRALRDERRALAGARLVIANSERTRRDLLDRLGIVPERIQVVYYGCDPARFPSALPADRAAARATLGWPPEGRTVLFIGALGDRRKGFDTLFTAWQRLAARPEWRAAGAIELAVIGRGAEFDLWRRRAADAGLASIRFLGFRRDVPELLAASDLLVAPTRYEAYGLGVHEALVCGLPVLVSASAGVAERLPPALEAWKIQDPDSETELEARLLHWSGLIEPPEFAELSRRLRAYTWDDMARDLLRYAGWSAAAAEAAR